MIMKKTCITFVAAIAALPIFAEIKMGAPFTDGAVLQRGMKVPVWGRVTPTMSKVLRKVRVEFAGQEKTAVVGTGGEWIKIQLYYDGISESGFSQFKQIRRNPR